MLLSPAPPHYLPVGSKISRFFENPTVSGTFVKGCRRDRCARHTYRVSAKAGLIHLLPSGWYVWPSVASLGSAAIRICSRQGPPLT